MKFDFKQLSIHVNRPAEKNVTFKNDRLHRSTGSPKYNKL